MDSNKPISVLFYIPNLSQDWGGSKQYSAAILRIMSRLDTNQYKIYIYHNSADEDILNTIKNNKHLIHITDNSFRPSLGKRIFRKVERNLKNIFQLFAKKDSVMIKNFLEFACQDLKIDIVHCPYQYLPDIRNASLICTMHDVQELHFPEFFSAEIRAARAVNYLKYLKQSDAVIVSFEHIKNDLIQYFSIDNSKVSVVLLEFDNLWFDKYINEHHKQKDKEKYLLYPANTWIHKNHARLIEAIGQIRDKYGIKVKLYCTGHLNDYSKTLISQIADLKLQNQIVFAGVLSEQQLFDKYTNAHGVVIPTLYEAGSFPLVESIFMNVPVICSNVTSLPDMIGDKKYVFDPYDVNSIAEKIMELYTNDDFREGLLKYLPKRKEIMMNKDVSRDIALIYNKLKNG